MTPSQRYRGSRKCRSYRLHKLCLQVVVCVALVSNYCFCQPDKLSSLTGAERIVEKSLESFLKAENEEKLTQVRGVNTNLEVLQKSQEKYATEREELMKKLLTAYQSSSSDTGKKMIEAQRRRAESQALDLASTNTDGVDEKSNSEELDAILARSNVRQDEALDQLVRVFTTIEQSVGLLHYENQEESAIFWEEKFERLQEWADIQKKLKEEARVLTARFAAAIDEVHRELRQVEKRREKELKDISEGNIQMKWIQPVNNRTNVTDVSPEFVWNVVEAAKVAKHEANPDLCEDASKEGCRQNVANIVTQHEIEKKLQSDNATLADGNSEIDSAAVSDGLPENMAFTSPSSDPSQSLLPGGGTNSTSLMEGAGQSSPSAAPSS